LSAETEEPHGITFRIFCNPAEFELGPSEIQIYRYRKPLDKNRMNARSEVLTAMAIEITVFWM
jgi:hypothetical protein